MILRKILYMSFSLSSSFAILGLKSTAKIDEIKKKYYELAKLYHPDVNINDENANIKFAELHKV